MPPHFIVIAGNIGVGKSTLTRLLSQELGWTPFYEPADENPYLADFYGDMRRWSFHSQIFFLGRRLAHHRQLVDHPSPAVQDRSLYEGAEIFARNLHEMGRMEDRDYASYRQLYTALVEFLPPPDLLIYLQASVETLTQRIQRRGRDYERTIPADYLARLNRLYNGWIADFRLCPALTIPADALDFVENPNDLAWVIGQVRERIGDG